MTPAADGRTFRAPSATIVFVASAAIALFLLGDAVLRAGIVTGMLLAPWVLLALWAVYVVSYASCVKTDADRIRVQNLLRIIDVPWQQVGDIDVVWQLRVHLRDGGAVQTFGGPTGGRPGRPQRKDAGGRPSPRPADRDLQEIRAQWEEARDAGRGSGAVSRSWDWVSLLALGALLTWAVIAVLMTAQPS